jgi:hypothetical protein
MSAPRPDADPAAFTCEWCDDTTADGWSLDGPNGWWVPTCHDCRTHGGILPAGEVSSSAN